jgi:hypothetical protein
VQLASDRVDARPGFRGDEGAAFERRAAADQFLDAGDCRRSSHKLDGAVARPCESRGPRVGNQWICIDLGLKM